MGGKGSGRMSGPFNGRKAPKKKSGKKLPYNEVNEEAEARLNELLPVIFSQIPEEPVDYHTRPTEAKLWCRAAWWSGKYTIGQLSDAINATSFQISSWIHGTKHRRGWAVDKEIADKKALSGAVRDNTVRMEATLSNMLSLLESSTVKLLEENATLPPAEFNMFMNAFDKLFKLRQLEMGRPTEIFAENGSAMTWSDIRKKIEEVEVPMFEVVDG